MISPGSGPHAHVAGCGRRWCLGTLCDLRAISALMRVEIAISSRRRPGGPEEATHGRSQLRERAVRIPEISTQRQELSSSARGGPNGAKARADLSWGPGRKWGNLRARALGGLSHHSSYLHI